MLKILYIAPEHFTGALGLFVRAHRQLGNDCRLVTLFHSRSNYPEDICLHLPLIGPKVHLLALRRWVYRKHGESGIYTALKGYPPIWKPANVAEKLFFQFRDALWTHRIHWIIKKHHLLDFDVYHLESGLDLFRDGRFVKQLKSQGKKIVCCYHGTDMRQRGVIAEIDALSDLNLTFELDLLSRHPRMQYLFLPIDTNHFKPRELEDKVHYIGHAPTNRYFKGSKKIIEVCKQLQREFDVKLLLIEKKPHQEALRLKAQCDIFIDQISNLGGWGYGMNSLESLAMGIPTCTNMVPQYEQFLPDHPFINVSENNLKEQIVQLILDADLRRRKGKQGREWVERHHDIWVVMRQLYRYYRHIGCVVSADEPD